MEHTNKFLPTVQPDQYEQQPKMDPSAWLLKVAIVRIKLQQKDPTLYIRSLPPNSGRFVLWCTIREAYTFSHSSSGDELPLACEIAALDTLALIIVLLRVEKDDNLREAFSQVLRSIRHAVIPHAGSSHPITNASILYLIKLLHRRMVASPPRSKQEYVDASESDSELPIAYIFHAFLTSVLHLLTSVFQYLIGYVDRGGSKTYSSGAFDFRDNFVSLVLFQGAYVWIKFRQAAPPDCRKRKAPDVEHQVVDIETCNPKGLHKRPIKSSSGAIIRVKYEPRFRPPRQEGDDGTDPCSKHLPLGEYSTPAEAQIVRQIARYYYDKDGGFVELKYGQCKFSIPPMSEQDRGLVGLEKRNWVKCRAKEVGKQMYADFQREKGKHLNIIATEAGSHGAQFNDPSSSVLPLACSSIPLLTAMAAEPSIGSAAPSSPSLPLFSCDGAIVGDVNVFSESLSGFEDMIAAHFRDPGSPYLPDHPSSVVSYQMQYQGFAQLVGDPSLLEVGAVPEGADHDSQPELNTSPGFQQEWILADAGTENIDGRIFLQQSDQVLQQVVFCQKCLGDNARQFVHLDQLKASEMQISKLQQEIESSKSRLQQVASLSCNLD